MTRKLTRREALRNASLLGAGVLWGVSAQPTRSAPSDKLNLAVIGIGGRGSANLNGVRSQNIVALCDVDDRRAGNAYKRFPQAERFKDYRRMFDKLSSKIDGVVISTPDHTHFHPSMAALQLKKHLYLEKPMAHSVWEVRTLTELAARQGVATQLGVQRHTLRNVHRVVEWIKAGVIGKVTEVHSWIGGERGMPKVPKDKPAVPSHLNWDLWLGPAADRSYHSTYAPYGWRFWWDFGTGETGNWGCHILDIPYWALDLTHPVRVSGSGPTPHPQTTPKQMATRLDFPAAGDRPAVKLYWSHAKKGPPILRRLNLPAKGNNTLFVGSEGMLLCGFGQRKLLPAEKFADVKAPEKKIPDSPGFYQEWLTACRGGEAATCNFNYSGPLTEAVLLGNVAYRAQTDFQWDARQLRAASDAAQALIKTPYRKGWEV